jgi:hypothetical protein
MHSLNARFLPSYRFADSKALAGDIAAVPHDDDHSCASL